ncbi:MAG TPA: hypothetical protein VFS05_00100 [Gemmatimonadaceae bacterium]|nr:hypothetical protein [Gemmatimonadaceae bacterium]
MRKYIRPLAMPLALSLVLAAGCAKDKDNAALNADSGLASDLEMANRDTAAQPQLSDVPAETAATPAPAPAPSRSTNTTRPRTTTPRTTTPRTTTPAPSRPATTASGNTVERGTTGTTEGRAATIPAGTTITLSSGSRVCTNTHKAGDKFTATVTEAVSGANGAVIPAGATAVVQVTSVKRSENVNDPAQIGLVVQRISMDGKSYPVDATIASAQVDRVRESTRGNDAKKVVGGAVAGAILGQVLGKDTKSTVIGAATGAAAGTAVAMGTADYAGCIPQGGTIKIRLNTPATITQ